MSVNDTGLFLDLVEDLLHLHVKLRGDFRAGLQFDIRLLGDPSSLFCLYLS